MDDFPKLGLAALLGAFIAVLSIACFCMAMGAIWMGLVTSTLGTMLPYQDFPPGAFGGLTSDVPSNVELEMGESAEFNQMFIDILEYEFSGEYEDPYGYVESPSDDAIFFWVKVRIANDSGRPLYTPNPEDFSAIIDGLQYDTYFFNERKGYESFISGELYPGAAKQGWVRFTIPEEARDQPIRVVFIPNDFYTNASYSWMIDEGDQ
jgi:hypothetical protein